MFPLRNRLPVGPFPPHGLSMFLRYYDLIRLLLSLNVLSDYKSSITLSLVFTAEQQTSQVPQQYLACLPFPQTPVESPHTRMTHGSFCLLSRNRHRLPLCIISRRIRLVPLSGHCGPHASLSTLKPHLAALAPRLSTGCPLRLCRTGSFTLLYYWRRTGALPSFIPA